MCWTRATLETILGLLVAWKGAVAFVPQMGGAVGKSRRGGAGRPPHPDYGPAAHVPPPGGRLPQLRPAGRRPPLQR